MRQPFLRGRPMNVVAALQLRMARADVMSCNWSAVDAEAGIYVVGKSDDTLKQMYYDNNASMNASMETNRPAATTCTFAEYKQALPIEQSHYHVNVLGGTCSCPDNRLLRMPCKHMFMIFKHTTTTFSDLPQHLVSSPSMVIDPQVVKVSCVLQVLCYFTLLLLLCLT